MKLMCILAQSLRTRVRLTGGLDLSDTPLANFDRHCGTVDWRLVQRLAAFGVAGAISGAAVASAIDTSVARPLIAAALIAAYGTPQLPRKFLMAAVGLLICSISLVKLTIAFA